MADGCQSNLSVHRSWWLAALLFVAVLLAYQPVWHAGFVWDDDELLTANPTVKSLNLSGPGALSKVWFSTASLDYYPMTYTLWWAELRLWGNHPLGFHLANVLLHALSAVLLWRILLRLGIPAAALAAAIFALHPVNVESVAWISEGKNALALFFFLGAVLSYLKFEDGEKGKWYAVALALFAFALFSKTAAAPLPVVLLGIAWWRRGRIAWEDVRRAVPFFVIALAECLVTMWFHYHRAMGHDVVRTDSFWSRLAGAGWAVWFYLYKAVLPVNLAFVYPRWQIDTRSLLSYFPIILLTAVLVGSFFPRRKRGGGTVPKAALENSPSLPRSGGEGRGEEVPSLRRTPLPASRGEGTAKLVPGESARAVFFALAYFIVMLLPVLGFLNIYFMRYSLIADHWQYFAIIGPIALAAGVIRKPYLAAPVLLALGALTWKQCGLYANSEMLWRDTLSKNPASTIARNDLSRELILHNQIDEATALCQSVLATHPDDETARFNLGTALVRRKRFDDAIAQFQSALKLQPDGENIVYNIAQAYLKENKFDSAADYFRKTLQIDPNSAEAWCNLGYTLLQQQHQPDAIAAYEKALELNPDYALAHNDLGSILLKTGRVEEAARHFQQAAIIEPDFAEAHFNLAESFLYLNRVDEAISQYKAALALRPDLADAEFKLGAIYARLGNAAEAISHYEKAVKIEPGMARGLSNLAWLLAATRNAALRNGPRAVELARRANELGNGTNPVYLGTLAAACAESGQFADAVKTIDAALSLAAHEPALAAALKQQGDFYRKGQPYRE